MHVIAATFLLPAGVAVYTFVGGVRSTNQFSKKKRKGRSEEELGGH